MQADYVRGLAPRLEKAKSTTAMKYLRDAFLVIYAHGCCMQKHGEVMKRQFFLIPERLPGLNEVINTNRRNRYAGANLKKKTDELIGWHIRAAIAVGNLKPVQFPCRISFTWKERTARRDCDNIAFAKKFVLDALQECGILPNDNQRWVLGFEDHFLRGEDSVLVEIKEEMEHGENAAKQ